MGWRDLITEEELTIVAPWVGGRSLHFDGRTRSIVGTVPSEHGWYRFDAEPRKATLQGSADPDPETLRFLQTGFLVGNRFVPDGASPAIAQGDWGLHFKQVHLLEDGLERFVRIDVGTVVEGSELIFRGFAYPLGPEEEVLSAFLDRNESLDGIKAVIPSLQAAFDLECLERRKIEQRREELGRLRRQEEERLLQEAKRHEIQRSLGNGAGRREMAIVDFDCAATAALAVGGATLLDVRNGQGAEKVVRYRLDGRRFECVCDLQLRIIDAGVCLTDEETGEKGDSFFTLESLPAVIRQAEREGVLVVFRHV